MDIEQESISLTHGRHSHMNNKWNADIIPILSFIGAGKHPVDHKNKKHILPLSICTHANALEKDWRDWVQGYLYAI